MKRILFSLLAFMALGAAAQTIPIGVATTPQSVAIGGSTPTMTVTGPDGIVRPRITTAGNYGTAVGYSSWAIGRGDTALGAYAYTGPISTTAHDPGEAYRSAIGYKSSATGDYSTAVGAFNWASGTMSGVFGFGSSDDGLSNVVSFGSSQYGDRRLIHVAAGINDGDAVNMSQFNGLSSQVSALSTRVDILAQSGVAGPKGDTGPQGPVGPAGPAGANAPDAVTADQLTAAANQATASAVATANTYTNARVASASAETLNWANAYTDRQVAAGVTKAVRFASIGTAQALAIPQVPQLAEGQKWIGGGYGSFNGASAMGIAFGYQVTEQFNIGGGVSRALSDSYGFGHHLAVKVSAGYAW